MSESDWWNAEDFGAKGHWMSECINGSPLPRQEAQKSRRHPDTEWPGVKHFEHTEVLTWRSSFPTKLICLERFWES